jgi:hypothetical protein
VALGYVDRPRGAAQGQRVEVEQVGSLRQILLGPSPDAERAVQHRRRPAGRHGHLRLREVKELQKAELLVHDRVGR